MRSITSLALGMLALASFGVWLGTHRQDAPLARVAEACPEADGDTEPRSLQPLIAIPDASVARNAIDAPMEDETPSPSPALRIRVTAVLKRSAPGLPDVTIRAGLGTGFAPEERALAEGVTDADGVVELVVPLSPGVERYWVRPVSAPWCEKTQVGKLPEDGSEAALELRLQEGLTARGRLLDEAGNGTAGSVQARDRSGLAKSLFGSGRANPEGWFELHVAAPGRYDLFGTRSGPLSSGGHSEEDLRVGALTDVVVERPDPPRDLELRLAGSGTLRGRLVDLAGKPLPGISLVVTAAELSGLDYGERNRAEQALWYEQRGGVHTWVKTDPEGRFEVRGLRPGGYLVLHEEAPLTPTPVPCDGPERTLVLDETRLVVRVVDAAGGPWNPPSERSKQVWPQSVRIAVFRAGEGLEVGAWHAPELGRPVGGSRLADGGWAYEVQPGHRYEVGLLGGALAWEPQRVSVPARGGLIEVQLTLPPERPTGKVELTVASEAGPVTDLLRIRIEDVQSGRPLATRNTSRRTTWPLVAELPAGPWRLVVDGEPSIDFQHGQLTEPRALGRASTDFEILPDAVTRVEAMLPGGARLDLDLRGSVHEADRRGVVEAWGEQRADDLTFWENRARVTLVTPQGWTEEVPFQYTTTGSSAAGLHQGPYLPIGTRQTSELLPAGRFTLKAAMPGGRIASAPVELIDGETTAVTLEL